MKLSARNQLPGTVVEVSQGAVNVGSKAVAVIKASNVIVGVED